MTFAVTNKTMHDLAYIFRIFVLTKISFLKHEPLKIKILYRNIAILLE